MIDEECGTGMYSSSRLVRLLSLINDFRLMHEIDELVQERRNSSALALELRLSCTKPLKYCMPRNTNLLTNVNCFQLFIYRYLSFLTSWT